MVFECQRDFEELIGGGSKYGHGPLGHKFSLYLRPFLVM